MRVAVLNPPWVSDGRRTGVRSGSRWPHVRTDFLRIFPYPFQLGYVASLLRRDGHDVLFRDCIAEGMGEAAALNTLADFGPDLMFHEVTTPTYEHDARFARLARERTSCIVVAGGQLATSFPEQALAFADYAIAGECELVMSALCRALAAHGPVDTIPGLAFAGGDGAIKRNPPELIADIDQLPWPDRTSVPMRRYQENFCTRFPNVSMLSSRGCPHHCSFCLEPHVFNHRPNYRARRTADVVAEMRYVVETFGAREIYFDDTSFTVNRARVRQLCQAILDDRLRVRWSCMADAKIDGETLGLMKASGCTGMKIGVETTNEETLKAINKPVSNSEVSRCVDACRKLGIFVHGTFILGLPGETEASLERTLAYAFRERFNWMQFSPAIPYPGTPFFDQARQQGWLVDGTWRGVDDNVNLSYPQLPAAVIRRYLDQARTRLNRRLFSNLRLICKYARLVWYLKDWAMIPTLLRRLARII